MKIGFIGLGIMGKPMSKNLVKAGYTLVVRDHNAGNEAELAELGATIAKTPKEVAEQVDVVITMVPNSPQVQEVCLGADGIIEGAHPDVVLRIHRHATGDHAGLAHLHRPDHHLIVRQNVTIAGRSLDHPAAVPVNGKGTAPRDLG